MIKTSGEFWTVVAGEPPAGHLLADEDEHGPIEVATDPRTLGFSNLYDRHGHHDVVEIMFNQREPRLWLARIAPAGRVTARVTTGADNNPVSLVEEHLVSCEAGWTLLDLHSLDALFGPQARVLTVVVAVAEARLLGDETRLDSYQAAVFATYPANSTTSRVQVHLDAAGEALRAVGADGLEWANAGSCIYGWELTALAARDLIDTVPSWTWNAYETLILPWRAAFDRPPHPHDTI